MNKKQLIEISENYVTFEIETNKYRSPPLNKGKIEFVYEGVLKITEPNKIDVFVHIKDINIVRGVRI